MIIEPKLKSEVGIEPLIEYTAETKTLVVPLNLHISLGINEGQGAKSTAVKSNVFSSDLQLESSSMRIPIIYDGLEERTGYDPNFLELGSGKTIKLPTLTTAGKNIAAPLLDNSGYVLKYHKFSVVMHKSRRLALFTASNVDWRLTSRPKNPATGKTYTREQLAGFPPDTFTLEQWVTDERIKLEQQLPDIFYTEDNKAFDKGHLVRREDVCWGSSFEDVQMANGDTYHVTNCSPQIKPLNQANHGVDNWGDFEVEIDKITKREKVIIFSGPVLTPTDRWFRGKDDSGPVKIQIPSSFWKIVVAKGARGPEAYGFIFKQNITAITEKELTFTQSWPRISVSDIELLMRGWVDFSDLKSIDQPI